jgi:hypothetical protein
MTLEKTILASHVLAGATSLLTGIGALAIGLSSLVRRTPQLTDALSLLFGTLALLAVRTDIRTFRRGIAFPPRWWLIHHIQAMVGSFIAAVTAFLVQNGSRLTGMQEHQWVFWIAPTLLGTLYIARETRKVRSPAPEGALSA